MNPPPKESAMTEIKDPDGKVLYTSDKPTVRGAVIEAVAAGANLYGADLYRADLYRANLYRADLYGADLSEADLYGANLSGAKGGALRWVPNG